MNSNMITINDLNTKQPVYKGCKNEQCFCTGKCKEVIGHMINGEYVPLKVQIFEDLMFKAYKQEKL